MAAFHFELVSPERQLVSAEVEEAVIPGIEGDLAALPQHAPLIAQLRPGILTIPSLEGREAKYFLRGGFADVGPAETIVLAEYAIRMEDFTPEMLTDEIAQAQQAFDDAGSDQTRFAAQDRLERVQSLRQQLAF